MNISTLPPGVVKVSVTPDYSIVSFELLRDEKNLREIKEETRVSFAGAILWQRHKLQLTDLIRARTHV